MTEEQATITGLREALVQVIYDTEEGSASDACQKVIETAEKALAISQPLWLRAAQERNEEHRVLKEAFGKLVELVAPRRDGSRPKDTLDKIIDVVMVIDAQLTMRVTPEGQPWSSLLLQIEDLQAQVASHERYRELVRSNVAKESWVKANHRLMQHITNAAEALFDGSKALQTFIPGSEAAKLQAGVDEAHRHLSAALKGESAHARVNWTLMAGIFSALDCMELNHNWDLSTGENEKLAKVFYERFERGFPSSQRMFSEWFDEAAVATWGADHTCDKTTPEEMKTFLWCLDDAYYAHLGLPYGTEDKFKTYMRSMGFATI